MASVSCEQCGIFHITCLSWETDWSWTGSTPFEWDLADNERTIAGFKFWITEKSYNPNWNPFLFALAHAIKQKKNNQHKKCLKKTNWNTNFFVFYVLEEGKFVDLLISSLTVVDPASCPLWRTVFECYFFDRSGSFCPRRNRKPTECHDLK